MRVYASSANRSIAIDLTLVLAHFVLAHRGGEESGPVRTGAPTWDMVDRVSSQRSRTPTRQRRTRTEVELARVHERYRVLRWTVCGLGVAAAIAATWLPLQPVTDMVQAVAGQQTDVRVLVQASISIAVALTATAAFTISKLHTQSKELRRLRERITELEGELETRQAQSPRE
jgi:hypothetical protein